MHLSVSIILTFVCCLPLFFQYSFAYPNGAPNWKCEAMDPEHGGSAQNSEAPYFFTISNDTYEETLTVTLEGCDAMDKIKGFLLEARVNGNSTAVGSFTKIPAKTKLVNCSSAEGGVTHSDSTDKTKLSFTWTPSVGLTGDVTFYATIVRGPASVYWNKHKSLAVKMTGGNGSPLIQSCPGAKLPTSSPTNSQSKINLSVGLVLLGIIGAMTSLRTF